MRFGAGGNGFVSSIRRIRYRRASYFLPGGMLLAAVVCFVAMASVWHGQDLSHVGDDMSASSMGPVTLVKGKRYRVNERVTFIASIGVPVGCDFSADGRSVTFHRTLPGPVRFGSKLGVYETVGRFKAPETGGFQANCDVRPEGAGSSLGGRFEAGSTDGFIDADRSQTISRLGFAGVGSATVGIALLAIVAYRRRDRETVPDLSAAWRRSDVAILATAALAADIGALAGSRHAGHVVQQLDPGRI